MNVQTIERKNASAQLQTDMSPLAMNADAFRSAGHQLVDRLADFLAGLPEQPVGPDASPAIIRAALGQRTMPQAGAEPSQLLAEAADLLFSGSVFNGHPRFWGYITSSAAPIGALADLMAATVNPNVGLWPLAPMASEIEAQTIRWIAELLDYPDDCGGLLVSGGNMANMVGFWTARYTKADWDLRKAGIGGSPQRMRVYVSQQAHTWVEKAADLSGLGTEAVRWIPTDGQLRMDTAALRRQIAADRAAGDLPFLVVGTAGTVSTGAIDPLAELAAIAQEEFLWFHVDAAYGGFAAMLPEAPADLKALREADSVAVDPHKWLYSPLEAGCTLVRYKGLMRDTFSYYPAYYPTIEPADEPPINFVEYGPQNSRGFRALKVWLALQQAGRGGYEQMLRQNIEQAKLLFALVGEHPELEPFAQNLSITTFRYRPRDLQSGGEGVAEYLNRLNQEVLVRLQKGGEAYLSNAVVQGNYLLRACIVNFRTTAEDIAALPEIVVRIGQQVDAELRPELGR
ncbi:MAG: aspartate aminotransferase family protein [Chloroflexi bacterium]|nr:MAG: aspartate aminotransferase family protein [Chloroflexota bacterium]